MKKTVSKSNNFFKQFLRKPVSKRFLTFFSVTLIFSIALLLVIVSEVYYVQPTNAAEKTNFISMIGGLFGGGALLAGAYFTWRQLQITLDGQITDRISKAVEHIGSEDLSIKLGGLYSLERIAVDSSRDLPKIIEILCAYVRVNSPSTVINREIHTVATQRELTDEELSGIISNQFHPPRLKEDIQVALQTLAKIANLHKAFEENPLVVSRNLFGINVQGARLPQHTDLSYFFIDNSQLDHIAIPAGSKLINSRICNTDLRGSLMSGVDLSNSDLSGSAMEHIRLGETILFKTRFLTSRLTCANFIGATAKEANFSQAKLKKAAFSKSILEKAYFGFANLMEASLNGADLREANFNGANLSKANFEDAKFKKTNLYKSNLTEAKGLTDEQLGEAILCRTILPNGVISDRDCNKLGVNPED